MKKASALAGVAGCAAAVTLLAAPFGVSALAAPAQTGATVAKAAKPAVGALKRKDHVKSAVEAAPAGIDTGAVAAAVEPAVVDVNTVINPLVGNGATGGAGTGMIVSPDGLIVTNNHVVSGADSITVTIPGHGKHAATFIGSDPAQDIALIKVTGLSGLPTITWGNSSKASVGTAVVAIGNALGLGGQPTVTQGIISATSRTISPQDPVGGNQETLRGLLQTDAPIAPGNSGGPLVNANDHVVGMDTATASAGTGASLGFAIPSNRIRVIAAEIESGKHLAGLVYGRTAFLGVAVVSSSQAASNPFGSSPFGSFGFGSSPFGSSPFGSSPFGSSGAPAPTKPGVVVEAVDPASGAAKAGIQAGDEITAVDGKPVTTTTALSTAIKSHKPGQVLKLTLYTGSASQEVQVHLGVAPVE
jgi:S1-C subfamily serine protease